MAMKKRANFIIWCFIAVMFLILITYFGMHKRHKEYKDGQVIYHASNSLGEIWVYQDKNMRCLYSRNPELCSDPLTCINTDEIGTPVFNYFKMALGALYLNPSPGKILMLGLGGGAMVGYLQTLVPEHTQFDIVEIDPKIIPISKEFFFLKDDERTRIFIDDAYQYVTNVINANANNHYDLIVVDVFDADYIPTHLLSLDFMNMLKNITTAEGGVVAMNTYGLGYSDTYGQESELAFKAFSDFYNLQDLNRMIIACNGGLPPLKLIESNAEKFHEKFNELRIDDQWLLSKFVAYSQERVNEN